MATIEDLLHRRTDLSTFLVHLTRTRDAESPRDNLLAIAENGKVEARQARGPAEGLEQHFADSPTTQKTVCFTETPLEHTWMMLEDIAGRQIQFEPYGLAITKTTARKAYFNPVWYSDISTRGGRDWPIKAVNDLIDDAKRRSTHNGRINIEELSKEPIFRLTPFIEQMGPTNNGGRKEFWWEREWRRIGDFEIDCPNRLVALFAPEDDHEQLQRDLEQHNESWSSRPILDPRWGLERMIAQLADIPGNEIGPFPEV